MPADDGPYALLQRVFREEAVSEAGVQALERWPRDDVPDHVGSWLLTTAQSKGLDRLRRDARYREKLAANAALPNRSSRGTDDRLQLIFTCCRPVLAREAQVARTVRAVAALTTGEIARAFMVPEGTLAKRIVRAKRKIVDSTVPHRVPEPQEVWLNEVLIVST